jgi:hypothetical protein
MRMQLDCGSKNIRRKLIAASCALLGTSAVLGEEDRGPNPIGPLLEDWQIQSAVAYYREDGRIQAIEPAISAVRQLSDGGEVGLNFSFDSLSGSSPNGALPSRQPQTFASPSAKSFASARHPYTVSPGRLPVDPSYSDARVAGGGDWTVPLTRLTRAIVGGKFSYEDDFYSATVNASVEHDFNDKNTTVALGVNSENDFLQPIGGTPVALSQYNLFEKTGNKSKHGEGLLLGVTQVMTRRWLTQANVSLDRFSGYLNDPYKIVSVLDTSGSPLSYVYENRPDSRTRRSVYLENRLGWSRESAALSLRYMTDTWGVHSETAQLRLRWWNSTRDQYFEPSTRWYHQTAADFYTPWITADTESNSAVSADSRLAAFHAVTVGLKYGIRLSDRLGRFSRETAEFTVRLEYYQQTLHNGTSEPVGLQGLGLYPSLKAGLLEFGFNY